MVMLSNLILWNPEAYNIADAINKLLPMKNLFIGVVLVPHICLNYCPSPDASF